MSKRLLNLLLSAFLLNTNATSSASANEVAAKCFNEASQPLDEVQKGELRAIEVQSKDARATNPDASFKDYEITAETNGKTFPVKARRYLSSVQPSQGVIVYLCGGPAVCSGHRPANIPPQFDIVTFDYIGLGQNALRSAQPELMSLESQGIATKKVVEALKLDQYLIYGQSFGTTVATVAAAKIGSDPKAKQPKAVILEGVSTARRLWNLDGYKKTADRAWELLSGKEREEFKKLVAETRAKAGTPRLGWIDVELTDALWWGSSVAAQSLKNWMRLSLDERLAKLSKLASENANDSQLDSKQGFDSAREMYKAAGCQTMPSKLHSSAVMFFDGEVRSPYGNLDFCACRTIHRDYDPKDFQITSPILYINGDMDPATPIEMAKYHFDSQHSSAMKKLIVVKEGGHFSTWRELAPCAETLFATGISGRLTGLDETKIDFSSGCSSLDQKSGGSQKAVK